jgi:eukaryotic-like serine/threonine-protein kinase
MIADPVGLVDVSVDAAATLLGGQYQLMRRLGGGSTVDVHAAFETVLGAHVALKCFREQSPGALRGLKAEFRALAETHHPNLVKLFDLVVTDQVAYFTMELVDGVTFVEYARTASATDLSCP